MVLIPPGSFMMGIPEAETKRENNDVAELLDRMSRPVHQVTIRQPFYMGEVPVTWGEYNQCVKAQACVSVTVNAQSFPYPYDDTHPVINVSHNDATSYTQWLRKVTGKDYRLPSEAQWEYAARAGTTTARYWGDDYVEQFGDTLLRNTGTKPVKSFRPNRFGLYDMLGHVLQWTQDCVSDKYPINYSYDDNIPSNEMARSTGNCGQRILRGGSWFYNTWQICAGLRVVNSIGARSTFLGFRVARTY